MCKQKKVKRKWKKLKRKKNKSLGLGGIWTQTYCTTVHHSTNWASWDCWKSAATITSAYIEQVY